jgi:hypothetical protein
MRGGNLGEKRFSNVIKEGNIAEMIHKTFEIGRRSFLIIVKKSNSTTAFYRKQNTAIAIVLVFIAKSQIFLIAIR